MLTTPPALSSASPCIPRKRCAAKGGLAGGKRECLWQQHSSRSASLSSWSMALPHFLHCLKKASSGCALLLLCHSRRKAASSCSWAGEIQVGVWHIWEGVAPRSLHGYGPGCHWLPLFNPISCPPDFLVGGVQYWAHKIKLLFRFFLKGEVPPPFKVLFV